VIESGAAPTPRFIDLQTHTTASDGVLPPAAVVEAAARAKLSAIAITDHDSISGVAEAERAGEAVGVRIVTGVELSAHFEGDEYHLLGLHIADRDRIERDLGVFREQRIDRARQIVEILNEHAMPITLAAVLAQAGSGAVGRPHVARALMAGGWVRDFREAFDRWLGWGKPAFVEKGKLTVAEATTLLHACGALAIWAHPGDLATESRLGKLKSVGLDGVEVLHPSHPQALAERIYDRAERLDLLPSGGSDWHGAAEGPRQLGGQLVPYTWLTRQDAAVAERRG
jgi:predicted metal-dependent phosphoesterase TrpH